MKKVITHAKPHHLDDLLAASVLQATYPPPVVEFKNSISQEEFDDPSVWIVDTGGFYDELNNNYDHHVNINLPCALADMMRRRFMLTFKPPVIINGIKSSRPTTLEGVPQWLRVIDAIDRFGFPYAIKHHLVNINHPAHSDITMFVKALAVIDPTPELLRKIGQYVIDARSNDISYESFMLGLKELIQHDQCYHDACTHVKSAYAALDELIKTSTIKFVDELKVAICPKTVSLVSDYFAITNAHILIHPNQRNPEHTSIVINTAMIEPSQTLIRRLLDELKVDEAKIVFRHPNLFLTVVNVPINEMV